MLLSNASVGETPATGDLLAAHGVEIFVKLSVNSSISCGLSKITLDVSFKQDNSKLWLDQGCQAVWVGQTPEKNRRC